MTIRLMMKYEESPSSWSSWRWEIIPFWSGWALSRSLRNNLWWERWAMIITWKWSKIWIREMILYHFQPGEESRTIRILIISALWHISTALANLLTGYILQVAFAVKFNPWSWCLILIPFQYSKPLGMIFLSLILILCISTPNSWGWWQYLPAAASWPFSMSSSLWRRSAALQYSLMPGMKASIRRLSFYIS